MFEQTTTVAGPSILPSAQDAPSLARYRIVKPLAAGLDASVFAAVARTASALSFFVHRVHPALAVDPRIRRNILEHAEAGLHVEHPNVVPIADVDEVDGELLIVTPDTGGTLLADLVRERIPFSIAMRLTLDALHGLTAVHEAGYVHGHLRPQNVIVGTDGVARIAELGIAERLCPTMGRYGYTAPEALESRSWRPSADTYALGVVLWEMLAGRRLFAADGELASLRLAAAAHVPTLIGVNRSIPVAFDCLLKRALARSVKDRFDGARGFADALAHWGCLDIATRAEVAIWLERRKICSKVTTI
jgi:eukaryotic-like serine/threonine-protein kinase